MEQFIHAAALFLPPHPLEHCPQPGRATAAAARAASHGLGTRWGTQSTLRATDCQPTGRLPESRESFEKLFLKILRAVLRKTSTVHGKKQPHGIISYFMYSQRPAADRCAFTDRQFSPPMIINQQTCCGLKVSKCQREISIQFFSPSKSI